MKSIIGLIESLKDDVSGSSPEKLNKIVTLLSTIYDSLDYSVEGILPANQGTVTLEDENIKEGINVSVYTSIYKVSPLSITVSDGRIVLTFNPQTVDMGIKVTFKKDVDWDKIINSTGIDTSDATALINDILSGKTAYVNGEKITGTMPSIPAISKTLNCGENYNIPEGYHDGNGTIVVNSASIQGLVNTSDATANASDMLSGKTAYINGGKVTGTIPVISATNKNLNIGDNYTIPKGYHDGNGKVIAPTSGGYNTKIDGVVQNKDMEFVSHSRDPVSVGTLPYPFCNGAAVVYNNEIHLLGGSYSSEHSTKHYKWNGSSWTSVSTLPYEFKSGDAVVYNNEIHILGGTGSSQSNQTHYRWNGSSWTSVSTLPYTVEDESVTVYNNELHLLGGSNISYGGTVTPRQKHYKWNGSSWSKVSDIPFRFNDGNAIVYNNELHILGGGTDCKNHYKWNGSSWTSVSTLPYEFYSGSAIIVNNEIRIFGSKYNSSTDNFTVNHKFNGNSWTRVGELPYLFTNGAVLLYKNMINMLGGGVPVYDSANTNNPNKHYYLYDPYYERIS